MRITILGCGRWGSFLAWYLDKLGNDVLLWGRESSEKLKQLIATRKNDYVTLPDSVKFSNSICDAISFSDYIIISIEGQNLRKFMEQITKERHHGKTFILCMKGLEPDTGYRFSEVASQYLGNTATIAILVGPGQPREIANGIPTDMVIDSSNFSAKKHLAKVFSSELITIHLGKDMIGNEIGAAAKNVVGIAGGMLDGMNMPELKKMLIIKGTREIAQLIQALGGNPFTAYDLCCLGDYDTSMYSNESDSESESNSRNFGISFVKKQNFGKYTPGKDAASPITFLAEKNGVKMPVISIICQILLGKVAPENISRVLRPEGTTFDLDI